MQKNEYFDSIMNSIATPVGELAALQSEALFQLKNDAADLLSVARAIVEHIDRALELKYADRAISIVEESREADTSDILAGVQLYVEV